MCSGVFCQDSETSDPIRDGGGARPLGLGRAVTASINDVNSIFYNPAGLAAVKSPQLMGMYYSKVFGTYNYFTAGAASPTPWGGVAGLAYVNSGISDIPVTITGTDASFANYTDNVFILSYADSLKKIDPDLQNIYVGLNAKLFGKGTSGTLDYHATGINFDLGAKYMPYNWLTFAMNKQNIFQGNIVWNTGHNEKYPSPTFIGTRVKDMNWGTVYTFDAEFPSAITVPTLYHVGSEVPVTNNFVLRLGADQAHDATNDKVLWNFAAGLGLTVGEFTVDYAYHTYYNDPAYGSHFVSVSYAANFENNIKAYAGSATGDKLVEGDNVTVQVYAPYSESYVEAVAPNGDVIPLKYDRRIDRWAGVWTIPQGYGTGKINFIINLLDVEGNPDPITTNDIIVITPEQASQEAALQQKAAEDAQKEVQRKAVFDQILKDIGEIRDRDQHVSASDMMTIISKEKKMMMANVEKREGMLRLSDVVNMLKESEMDESKRVFLNKYLESNTENRDATYNDVIDAVLASDYFSVEVPPVAVAKAPEVTEKKIIIKEGIEMVETPQKLILVAQAPAAAPAAPAPVAVAPVAPAAPVPEGMGGPVKEEEVPVVISTQKAQVVAAKPPTPPAVSAKPAPGSKEDYAALVDKTFMVIEKYIGIKDLRGKQMHRKDAAVIIAKRNNYLLPETEGTVFSDVDPSLPEAKYIQACYENKVLVGYPDRTFRPNLVISSYELLWMMSDSERSGSGKAAVRAYTKNQGNIRTTKFDYAVNASIKTGYLKEQTDLVK